MALWLFKEEPTSYSYAHLERDGSTLWDGVDNALARKYLRQMARGDRVLFYHTGKEKAVVGEMRVCGGPRRDPNSDDLTAVVVEVAPVRRWPSPVTLARIKADPVFKNWELVRLPRLSVVPVEEAQWERLEQLGAEVPGDDGTGSAVAGDDAAGGKEGGPAGPG